MSLKKGHRKLPTLQNVLCLHEVYVAMAGHCLSNTAVTVDICGCVRLSVN